MSAEIIQMPVKRNAGNGAREALGDIVRHFEPEDQEIWADWVLTSLWLRGFKIVPLEDSECG